MHVKEHDITCLAEMYIDLKVIITCDSEWYTSVKGFKRCSVNLLKRTRVPIHWTTLFDQKVKAIQSAEAHMQLEVNVHTSSSTMCISL